MGAVLREQNALPYGSWIMTNLLVKAAINNCRAGRAAKWKILCAFFIAKIQQLNKKIKPIVSNEAVGFFYCKNFKRRREKMRFRNDIHKRRFEKEIKKMDKKDNTQMAIVFLLTANLKLWNRCKI